MSFSLKTFFVALVACFILAAANPAWAQGAPDPVDRVSDYDGDDISDLTLWDPTTATFTVRPSTTLSPVTVRLGFPGDRPVVGDFNGDGKADLAAFNAPAAYWSVNFTDGGSGGFYQGLVGDIALAGNVGGGECANPVNYNPRTGFWNIGECDGSALIQTFVMGGPGFYPLVGDLDCDGTDDPIAFNRSTGEWRYRQSSNGNVISAFSFGLPGDIPLAGRYTSGSCSGPAVHRTEGNVFINGQPQVGSGALANVVSQSQFGLAGDVPFLVNADSDTLADLAVFRSSSNSVFLQTSAGSFFQIPFSGNTGALPLVLGSLKQSLRKVDGDYNRDGSSDLTFVEVDRRAGTSVFRVRHGGTGTQSNYRLSAAADAVVPGDFNGDGRTQPAIVHVRRDSSLIWHYIDGSGSEQTVLWGLNGDTPLTGDMDCDGRDDKIAVRESNGTLFWFILLANGTSFDGLPFGFTGDTPRVADMNGDTCDEFVISREFGGGIDWWFQNINDVSASYVQWGLVGDTILDPADLNGDGRADFIATRTLDGAEKAFVRFAPGVSQIFSLGAPGVTPLVGKFSGLEKNELAALTRGGREVNRFTILRGNASAQAVSFGANNDLLSRPDGTTVAPDEIVGIVDCDRELPWSGGRLWKPESDNTGAPVILFPSFYWTSTNSIELFDADGNKIQNLTRRTCCPNSNRAHYDVFTKCERLEPRDPLTMRVNRSNGVKECYEVPDACNRYD